MKWKIYLNIESLDVINEENNYEVYVFNDT